MSDLKLDSLRIQNFRTFKDLTIDRLGRVNLIVGKNNVGKTSLLEAIHLYVQGATGIRLSDLVSSRRLNLLDKYRSTEESDYGVRLPSERHLFHGRPDLSRVAPDDEGLDNVPTIKICSKPKRNLCLEVFLKLDNDRNKVSYSVQSGEKDGRSSKILGEKIISVFLTARDVRAEAEEYWDQIALTDDEARVIEALRIIDEKIEDVGYATPRSTNGQHLEDNRFPIARLSGTHRPEPLGNLGEGMNRTFALAIGLSRAKNGILLIDEIENGLHYSIQPDLWRMIFETAQELDVQVFATTHSYDCVKAFQQVSEEHSSEEGMLIQLRRKRSEPKNIVAVTVDEDELQDALKFQVDPR